MARINSRGYIEARRYKGHWKGWWLGKAQITLGCICIPKQYRGKRLRFKVEPDEDNAV